MKLLKKILIGLAALIGIALIVAFFVKKEYVVVREIVINKPKQEVFEYLKPLKNQNNWTTWTSMDPAMKQVLSGTDGEIGAVSKWTSKVVGNGEQEIKKITNGERIDNELRFEGASASPAYFITESVSENQTKVKWGMSGTFNYPMNLMLLFMDMEKMIGVEYEKSLQNLKGVLEK
jgi:uncharacterized membrane protein